MRYEKLLQLIDIFQPQTLLEVGTWNGDNAVRMIAVAKRHHSDITYIGYDLFEEATPESDKEEFNVKPHHTHRDVSAKLENTGAVISLIRGNTNETLKDASVDFVFIDGGHSLETIANDYQKLKKSDVVVFDDYYTPDENGEMPDISKVGCNRVVEELPHAVIECTDRVVGGGYVNLAVVFGG